MSRNDNTWADWLARVARHVKRDVGLEEFAEVWPTDQPAPKEVGRVTIFRSLEYISRNKRNILLSEIFREIFVPRGTCHVAVSATGAATNRLAAALNNHMHRA